MVTVAANTPQFFYPFLGTTVNTDAFEYLKLTSLGVIGTLVKVYRDIDLDFMMLSQMTPNTIYLIVARIVGSRIIFFVDADCVVYGE